MAYKEKQPVILVKNTFNPALLIFATAAGILGYWLYRKSVPIQADVDDPLYMINDPEYSETYHSTDDDGGSVDYEQHVVGRLSAFPRSDIERALAHYNISYEQYMADPSLYPLPNRRGISAVGPSRDRKNDEENLISNQGYANYPYFTGGTFINPDVLPPVRTYTLQ